MDPESRCSITSLKLTLAQMHGNFCIILKMIVHIHMGRIVILMKTIRRHAVHTIDIGLLTLFARQVFCESIYRFPANAMLSQV